MPVRLCFRSEVRLSQGLVTLIHAWSKLYASHVGLALTISKPSSYNQASLEF